MYSRVLTKNNDYFANSELAKNFTHLAEKLPYSESILISDNAQNRSENLKLNLLLYNSVPKTGTTTVERLIGQVIVIS